MNLDDRNNGKQTAGDKDPFSRFILKTVHFEDRLLWISTTLDLIILFKFKLGDFMIIKDHLFLPGLCGFSPLVGKNDSSIGPRFLPMGDAYDPQLQEEAKQGS